MRFIVLLGLFTLTAFAVPPVTEPDPKSTADATSAAKRATVPAGMTVSVWAAEPLMMNPVAFCFDEKGVAYVAETTRFDHGVPDTRGHMGWLDEDIGSRSVADRLAMYEKHNYYKGFDKYDDIVRKVWDSTGKGVADKSTVFSSGYNKPEDGLGAGVLARKGSVYYTNIPSLYKLKDTKGDGVADVKKTLSTGYGVRVQFIGHDLHGLRMGPDGRLYFSIGDRGFNITTKEGKHLFNPDSGAVLRCEPDGSNLEIVHTGLRNPQKLAFDDAGNLFTYDNNCDSGDKARWVHIVPGGDSGWRCGYQYGTYYHTPAVKQGNRGPWNTENIWHLNDDKDGTPPAYVLPPLAHFGNGPSGITHYPGVGLNDKYKDHFFATDFTSSAASSKIWSLGLKPKGASFEVVDLQPFVSNMVPTDCEFGPDGAFYWSDWTGGWNPPMKGRLFKAVDAEAMKNPAVKEAQELIAKGMGGKTEEEELLKLLDHPHFNVRQEAQYELSTWRYEAVIDKLVATIAKTESPRVMRHGIWALAGIYRADDPETIKSDPRPLASFLDDKRAEVRLQAVRSLGDVVVRTRYRYHFKTMLKLLRDPEPAVQLAAALALHRVNKYVVNIDEGHDEMMAFADRVGSDPYLRHGAVMLLASYGDLHVGKVEYAPGSLSKNQKLVLALALRRIGGPQSARRLVKLLNDADTDIALASAQAIYDERMLPVMPALAALTEKSKLPDSIAFRALAANFMIGDDAGAKRLVAFAARTSEPDYLRVTALKLLADWPKPPRRDPITGLTIDLKPRDAGVAKAAMLPLLNGIFSGSDTVRKEAVACVSKLGLKEVGPVMVKLVKDDKLPVNTRVDALFALQALNAKELGEAIPFAAMATEDKLKAAARIVRAKSNPKVASDELTTILNDYKTSVIEKKMILDYFATVGEAAAIDNVLDAWLDKLIDGMVPAEFQLELLDAAEARSTAKNLKLHADLKAKLKAYDTQLRKKAGDNLLKRYPDTLSGGDVARGREIFINNNAAACQKCHKLDNQGGEVGPAMETLKKAYTRDYLLEAIVMPNAHIAEGFQSVILQTSDGKTISGVLRKKEKDKYTIITPENKVVEVLKEDIESEKPDKSAMPEDVYKKLSRRELRDVVEFLESVKR
ncbi:c-type cytochrome [soil metagenome]